MKLEAGKDTYPLRDFGEMVSLAVDTGEREGTGCLMPLMQIGPEDWFRNRGDTSKPAARGVPKCFAIIGPEMSICLHPAPDKDYELIGRYYPALRML